MDRQNFIEDSDITFIINKNKDHTWVPCAHICPQLQD